MASYQFSSRDTTIACVVSPEFAFPSSCQPPVKRGAAASTATSFLSCPKIADRSSEEFAALLGWYRGNCDVSAFDTGAPLSCRTLLPWLVSEAAWTLIVKTAALTSALHLPTLIETANSEGFVTASWAIAELVTNSSAGDPPSFGRLLDFHWAVRAPVACSPTWGNFASVNA